METVNTNYKLKLRGGGNMVDCKPVFPNDPYCSLLCASGDKMKVLRNGKCIRAHSGHDAKITSIVMNPSNGFQNDAFQIFEAIVTAGHVTGMPAWKRQDLFSEVVEKDHYLFGSMRIPKALTSSLDGTVIRWDWMFGGLVSRYKFECPVYALYADKENRFFAITGTNVESCNLIRFTLSENLKEVVKVKVLTEGTVGAQNSCSVGCKGEFVAFIKRKSLFVYNTATKELKKYSSGKHLTCVTCHPTEFCIATGCKDGSIVLWQNFLDAKSDILKSIKHWHSLPVLALEFTAEGSMLLSGGHECVLIKWSLPAFKKSNTLPRLESPIVGIACSKDSVHYSVCYSDNGIQLINNHFVIEQTYQGLVMAHHDKLAIKRPIETGLHFDPRTTALVLNGRHGHLQFFDVKNEEQLYQLHITGENYVSPDSPDNPLDLTEVENMAFDVNGDWLATIERRDPKYDSCVWGGLKFWSYEKESRTFTLNTFASIEYDATHREKVCTLKFRPAGHPLAVTVCPEEKIFRLWCVVEDKREEVLVWRPYWQQGFMKKKPTSGDFNEDGTVLAVAFENEVAFFNPENEFQLPVTHNPTYNRMFPGGRIRTVIWANGWYNDSILMGATDSCLFAYNFVTKTSLWQVEVNGITTMVSNPREDGCVAVFSRNRLSVYKPSTGSEPSFTFDIDDREVITAAFDICSSKTSIDTLYFMTSDQELFSLVEAAAEEKADGDFQMMQLEQNIPMRQLRLKAQKKMAAPVRENKTSKQLLKETIPMPIYSMPPVELLCSQFLEAVARESLGKMNKLTNVESKEEDSESEEEKNNEAAGSASEEEPMDVELQLQDSIRTTC